MVGVPLHIYTVTHIISMLLMCAGQNSFVRKPSFPYIPGLDVCGVVEEVDESDDDHLCSFKVGDIIIGTWDNYGVGGMSEYALVLTDRAALKPPGLSPVEGAALVNSVVHALSIVERADIQSSDRVLVLGGGGGVGSSVVQMLTGKASFLACTSSDTARVKALGAHRAVDYRHENWWEVPEFREDPFDIVIDCAEGAIGWDRCKSVLKSGNQGGRWMAVVQNRWEIPMTAWYHILAFACPLLGRLACSCCCQVGCCGRLQPRYLVFLGEVKSDTIARTARYYEEHKDSFRVVLHNDKAFSFTLEGVVEAFATMEGRKGHGNVVVNIADE